MQIVKYEETIIVNQPKQVTFFSKLGRQIDQSLNVATKFAGESLDVAGKYAKQQMVKAVDATEKTLVEFHEETLIPFLATHPGITQTLSINDTFHSVGWLQRKAQVDKIMQKQGKPVSGDDSVEG